MKTSVLSFDIGASSGRGILVTYEKNKFHMEEIHRFTNPIISKQDNFYWNVEHLLKEIKSGIKKAYVQNGDFKSLGIDTWGCDYGWIDENGKLIGNPRCYRSDLGEELIQQVHKKLPLEDLYSINGNAFFPFNSIYQIYNDIYIDKVLEKGGKELLFMPNLLMYMLTGKKSWEYTIASTTGLMDAKERKWSDNIFKTLDIPRSILGDISHPMEQEYSIKSEILEELGIESDIKVTEVATHDSASAVIGAALGEKSAYLINGTWSLLGIESSEPIINSDGVKKGLVNEGSSDKKIRFLNLIIGTWLFQKLKEEWNKGEEKYDYSDFSRLGRESIKEEFIEITNEFISPANMEELIKEKYKEKYKETLEGKKEVLRVVYNTLANQYMESLNLIEEYSGINLEEIVMVGGGTQDDFLVDSVKKYTGKQIKLGPIEASALGNAVCQLVKAGVFESIEDYKSKVGV